MKKLAANMTVLLLMIGMMVAIPAHAFIGTNLKITFKDQQCTKACQNHIQKLVNEHLAINKSEFKINPQPALESYINKAMRAEGYYNSTTMISVDKYTNNITEILITAGNILTFGALNYTSSIDSHLSIKELYLPSLTSLGLKTGQAGQAYKVISAVDAITAHINKNYCLFHVKVEHEAIIDNLTNQLHVNFIITTGPRSVFGETKFEGANSFSAIFLKKLLPWKEGVCFKQEQLQKAQIELLQHDYFSTAFIKLPKTVAPNGKIPITIHVKELPSRTVKIGLNYSSDLGPGIQLGWQHNNLLSTGEKLTIESNWQKLSKEIKADFRKPFFLKDNQTLQVSSSISQDYTPLFRSKSFETKIGIERVLTKNLLTGIGIKYTLSKHIEPQPKQVFRLVSAPIFLTFDTRNTKLDPLSGWMIKVNTEPFVNSLKNKTSFLKSNLIVNHYINFNRGFLTPTLALRVSTGSIIGKNTQSIPANERFYSGDSFSVRGYAYQKLSKLEQQQKTGGLSFIETSAELRLKFNEDWGMVGFIDGGNIFNSSFAKLNKDMSYGAGVGVRYFTRIGPLRADIAFPLQKQNGTHKAFQLYFSIGQSF